MTLYDKANGTGPFRLDTWDKSGAQILLSRFDEYWRGPAQLKSSVIKNILSFQPRLLMPCRDADGIYVDNRNCRKYVPFLMWPLLKVCTQVT